MPPEAADGKSSLFAPRPPLAERLRPRSFSEFLGQPHLLGKGRLLTRIISHGKLPSLILWGPPGCGKTTLAKLLAKEAGAHLATLSAVDSGVKDLRKVVEEARRRASLGRKTVLFIDEIHRFNKAQQDFLLPYVEDGTVTLIGATTENPSFSVIAPLLSRCRVVVLNPLSPEDIRVLLERALRDPERGYGREKVEVEPGVLELLAEAAEGDARVALNYLETLVESTAPEEDGIRRIRKEDLARLAGEKPLRHDRSGEEHYNLLSAFHKSLRGSDPDAALYWMVRLLEAGEDPRVILRRILAAASEDVGNADPMALLVAVAAKEAYEFLGSPEGELALAQAAVYVACAPKSNAVYRGLAAAREDVRRHGALPVPMHLRNPVTALMRALGYGKGYRYAHDYPSGFVEQQYLPDELRDRRYYRPTDRGFEATIRERLLKWWRGRKG
ncbi:replication-associated recombination protein A [Thermosulfurimonas sp. F29]|uniref:replication-associated recombination protein A n=1 Tax=Thermosulfurimonas sp. F29 TaxID=2867247 RepID=UPI001C8294F2|nr:replication-associated recombination protein A [Thermosulfurimonas sp. F29]MBX6422047.1 replication-associated recombination protein A [Thermosulfurimonas sp. F29]